MITEKIECNFDRGNEWAQCPYCGDDIKGIYINDKLRPARHCKHFVKFVYVGVQAPFALFAQKEENNERLPDDIC